MPDEKVCYREIPVYKYKLAEDYEHQTALTEGPRAIGDWVVLGADGVLKLKQGYAWDGPSGPSFDTPSFMRGSLVHDALYQMMRNGLLPPERRQYADEMLRTICRTDGMNWLRAQGVYRAVRLFGAAAAEPRPDPPVVCAP